MKFADKEIRWSSQGMLRLTQEAMSRLFQSTVDNIHRIIASLLDNPNIQGQQFLSLFLAYLFIARLIKPNSVTLSGSKLVADMFEAGRRPASKISDPDHRLDTSGIAFPIRHYWEIRKVVNGHSLILIRQMAALI